MKYINFGMIMASLISIACSSVQAQILSLKTMDEVQEKFEAIFETYNADDILGAMDVDMTLIQSDHPAVYYPALKKYKEIYLSTFEKLSKAQRDIVNTLIVKMFPQRLVESNAPQIIKNLQEKIKVIAFTASLTGKLSDLVDKGIFLRWDQLQQMGFDFSKGFDETIQSVSFTDIPLYVGSHPIFYQGILSSNGEGSSTKGETLVAFLKYIRSKNLKKEEGAEHYPKVVILVDDRMKNLTDVQDKLKAYDPSIVFIGIEYQGAYSYAPKDISKEDISKEDFSKFWEDMAEKAKAESLVIEEERNE